MARTLMHFFGTKDVADLCTIARTLLAVAKEPLLALFSKKHADPKQSRQSNKSEEVRD